MVRSATLDENDAEQFTSTIYNGLIRTVTNAKSQSRVEIRTVTDQLAQVTDAAGGVTVFTYDPSGNLTRTRNPRGNLVDVEYDLLGRRTKLLDPDLGEIQYVNDPLGRVLTQSSQAQRDAGGRTDFSYDKLDRRTGRFERDLRSYWEYDSAPMGKGQLAETYTGTPALKDYRRVHSYDALGRPATTTQTLTDGTYTSSTQYDGWGRVIAQTAQRRSDAPKEFALRYNETGYLSRVERGALVLWKAVRQDASGRVTEALLGNGLTQLQSYNPGSGRLQQDQLKTSANALRVDLGYEYDAIGSVTKRTQYWDTLGFDESFTYDNLNRLTGSQILGQGLRTVEYYADGAIKTKTGVGSAGYEYPAQGAGAVQPHAVQNIGGYGRFTYDKNGNLITAPGRTTSWTSFDMPLKITKGGNESSFVYGSEYQRTRQDRSDGTTIVYAGTQEVESKGGQVTVKTYWPLGLGVEIDRAGATELNWLHKDRLGSPVAISDQGGVLKEKLAYDAWGKRRSSVDHSTLDTLDGQVDNKGYTNHEMLDQLDLVHMNGRVYDPLVGRFLSGDPFIQDPSNGQNYDRYSYVLNNPTNLTDPTGFVSCNGSDGGSNAGCDIPQVEIKGEKTKNGNDMSRFHTTQSISIGASGAITSVTITGSFKNNNGNTKSTAKFGGSAISGGGGAAERVVERHRSDMEAGNGAVYEPLQPAAVAVTGAALGGSGFAALATTSAGRVFLAMLGIGAEVQGMADGVPPAGRGIAGAAEAGSIRGVNAVGGTMNCVNCVVATDATLAGRAASAMPGGPYRISVLEKQFGGRFSAPGSIGDVSNALSKAGDGARGIIFGSRGNEVGHVFNVVNQKGVVRYLDGQTGKAAVLDGYKSFQLLRTN